MKLRMNQKLFASLINAADTVNYANGRIKTQEILMSVSQTHLLLMAKNGTDVTVSVRYPLANNECVEAGNIVFGGPFNQIKGNKKGDIYIETNVEGNSINFSTADGEQFSRDTLSLEKYTQQPTQHTVTQLAVIPQPKELSESIKITAQCVNEKSTYQHIDKMSFVISENTLSLSGMNGPAYLSCRDSITSTDSIRCLINKKAAKCIQDIFEKVKTALNVEIMRFETGEQYLVFKSDIISLRIRVYENEKFPSEEIFTLSPISKFSIADENLYKQFKSIKTSSTIVLPARFTIKNNKLVVKCLTPDETITLRSDIISEENVNAEFLLSVNGLKMVSPKLDSLSEITITDKTVRISSNKCTYLSTLIVK